MKLSNKGKRTFQPITAATMPSGAKVTHEGVGYDGTQYYTIYDKAAFVRDVEAALSSLGCNEPKCYYDESIQLYFATGKRYKANYYTCRVSLSEAYLPSEILGDRNSYKAERHAQCGKFFTDLQDRLRAAGYAADGASVATHFEDKETDNSVIFSFDDINSERNVFYIGFKNFADREIERPADFVPPPKRATKSEINEFKEAYENLPWEEYVDFVADYESNVVAKAESYLAAEGLSSETSVQNGQGADIIYRDGEIVAQIDYEEELQTLGQLLIDNRLDIDKTAKAFADYVLGYVEG